MKIGFYKPYKKVFFHNDNLDTASVSYEIVNVMKIFAERGHQCYILSSTDYKNNSIKKINRGSLDEYYDRIFLYSGVYDKDLYGNNIFNILRKQCEQFDFVLTDLRLYPLKSYFKYFDNVYSIVRKHWKYKYAGNNESYLYKNKIRKLKKKTIQFYFGGEERNRLNKIIEYIYRPNVKWTGKSNFFEFSNKVSMNQYHQNLDRAKYSICIADDNYDKNHALTQRLYEGIIHNVLMFIDKGFDRYEYIIPKNTFLRVKNYCELYEKMFFIDSSPALYSKLLKEQKKYLKKEYFDGSYVYKLLQ